MSTGFGAHCELCSRIHTRVCSHEMEPQLARFKGRPGELSPKARFWLFAGWLLPSRFKYVLLRQCLRG